MTAAARRSSPENVPDAARTSRATGRALLVCAIVLVVGLAARLYLAELGTKWGYPWDHMDNIGMGATASQSGLLKVYSIPVEANPVLDARLWDEQTGQWQPYDRRPPRVANYPPLGVTLFYLTSSLLEAIDPAMPLNTFTSRTVGMIFSVAAGLVLAVGVWRVAGEFAGPKAAMAAGAVCWLFPPLMLDSAFWGQTDTWFLAPAVWALWLLIRRRWLSAGAVCGLALMLKPQGLFLGPVVLLGTLFLRARRVDAAGEREQGFGERMRSLGLAAAGTFLVVALIAAPWTLSTGWDWLNASYVQNFSMYSHTSLMAFNVWYLDLLGAERAGNLTEMMADSQLAGLTRKAWGQLLTLTVLAALAALTVWRYRHRREMGLAVFSALWLWSLFVWPTGVHERYIVYAIPLVVALAATMRRYWPAVLVLAVVGALEITHPVWVDVQPTSLALVRERAWQQYHAAPPDRRPPPGRWNEMVNASLRKRRRQIEPLREKTRLWEMLATAAVLGGYGFTAVASFAGRDEPGEAEPTA